MSDGANGKRDHPYVAHSRSVRLASALVRLEKYSP